jgi:prevent-host-death family protein
MATVNVHDAKTQLSRLLAGVERGEEVVIARAGKPIARLVPYAPVARRKPGALKGSIHYGDDLAAPLPPDLAALFNGEEP